MVCGNPAYIGKYDMVRDVKPGGIFMLNCDWEGEELEARLPADIKRAIAEKNIQFYTCDAVNIARSIGLKGRINTIIQSAYFKLADLIPAEEAIEYMKQGIINDYGTKGQNIVDMNVAAVMAGQTAAKKVDVPASWATAQDGAEAEHRQRRAGCLCPQHPHPHQQPGRRRAARLRVPALCHRQGALRHGCLREARHRCGHPCLAC